MAPVSSQAPIAGAGIVVDRYFTQGGKPPLELIEWELRRSEIKDAKTGEIVFEMDDVEVPAGWSQLSTDVCVSKYFRKAGVPETGHEVSVRQVVERLVCGIVSSAKKQGGYFAADGDEEAFADELRYLLATQRFAFNSPVWFNVGLHECYGIRGNPSGRWAVDAHGKPYEVCSDYERPGSSACFIQTIEDDLMDIAEHAKREMRVFKAGGGSGANYSKVRGEGEPLSGGGTSSGVMSFLDIFDKAAGATKSGGTCLAPDQRVWTEAGPIAVKTLAERGNDFIVLSYDPPAGRYKAKRARAWLAGEKKVVEVTTDKGKFRLSFDHPVRLADHATCLAGDLKPGMSLLACSVDRQGGYLRVHLRDGRKGEDRFHRMVAADVMGFDLEDRIVHHADGNKDNNHPSNLEVMTQSEHAAEHTAKLVERGEHIFQAESFSHDGEANGMHRSAEFWQDEERVVAYKAEQSALLTSERAAGQQKLSTRQRMMNLAYRIANAGLSIDTFDDYYAGRKKVATLGGMSRARLLGSIERHFGSYDQFVRAVRENNHKVLSVAEVGDMPVYDVEVDCLTADDKTWRSGHNFVIWSDDDPVGRGVVVYNTRRAARMVVLDIDHPDVLKFIDWKKHEEAKVAALVAQGYSDAFEGEAYRTVSGQNANNSVRVTDEFMEAAAKDLNFSTRWRTTGDVAETYSAREMMQRIGEAAWACADPGMQFHDTCNAWNTTPNFAPIRGTNPCGEYSYVDDSACNLGSINLLKFLNADGSFDVVGYMHACRIAIIAQEILVDYASYPTASIARNSHLLRPLGLGYANLGAMLMRLGLPYDSDEGRAWAGAITALMCGSAWLASAEIASAKGPFAEFERNREEMLDVARRHAKAVHEIESEFVQDSVIRAAEKTWSRAISMGEQHGYRNAQLSLIAPTGTIGLVMGCDTTGIEPAYMPVMYKKLAGGGTMKIANNSIGPALERLGYDDAEIDVILDYVATHETVEGAPHLKDKHLTVFDCAVAGEEGTRFIEPMGHIKMMAAAQPFLCGAISKTANVPEETTPQEIIDLYTASWTLGLKCIAIYRDNSKRAQVLNAKKQFDGESAQSRPKASRIRLPKRRHGFTQEAVVGGHKVYLRAGEYEDGTLGEIFIDMHKEGATLRAWTHSFAILMSIALQHGVPLEELVDAFTWTRFEPHGPVAGHPHVKQATSIIDYIFRTLGIEYLDRIDLAHVHPLKIDASDDDDSADGASSAGAGNGAHTKPNRSASRDAGVCPRCNGLTTRSGTCSVCVSCGTTTGCS